MYLCRLIYASYATREFTGPELDELLLVSRHNNARSSLTGVLFTHGRHFFQVLEGERTRVNELYHRIARDPRHGSLLLIGLNSIEERAFVDWEMGYVSREQVPRRLLLQFGLDEIFEPQAMTAEAAFRLARALSEHLRHGPVDTAPPVARGERAA